MAPQVLCLAEKGFGHTVHVFDRLDSTNDYCKRAWEELPDKAAIIARQQYAGKGRLGRVWQDSPGDTLSMSVMIKPSTTYHTQELPFVCGLSVRKALESLSGRDFGVKWVNDVVIGGKKICGILCESRVSASGGFVVAGIGINVGQAQSHFDRIGLDHGTSLRSLGIHVDILEVAAAVLRELERYYTVYVEGGFHTLCPEYNRYCVNIGREVRVLYSGRELIGTAREVDREGALCVQSGKELVLVQTGEASVRGMYGYY